MFFPRCSIWVFSPSLSVAQPLKQVSNLSCFKLLQILTNLRSGRSEDGKKGPLSADDKNESTEFWNQRRLRIIYALANCAISQKVKALSVQVLKTITFNFFGHRGDIILYVYFFLSVYCVLNNNKFKLFLIEHIFCILGDGYFFC